MWPVLKYLIFRWETGRLTFTAGTSSWKTTVTFTWKAAMRVGTGCISIAIMEVGRAFINIWEERNITTYAGWQEIVLLLNVTADVSWPFSEDSSNFFRYFWHSEKCGLVLPFTFVSLENLQETLTFKLNKNSVLFSSITTEQGRPGFFQWS